MNWCWGSVLQYRNPRRWKSHGWGSHDVERMFVPYQSVADGVGSFWQPHACNGIVTGIRGCNGKYYCKGEKFCVYGTFLRLTPTSPSPTFDQHRSSLFFSSTEKNESSIPPKSRLLILKCRPFMKLFTIFAMQSHGGNIKKCDCIVRFFYIPRLPCKVRIKPYKKTRRPCWELRSPNPVQNLEPNIVASSIPMMHQPKELLRQGALSLRSCYKNIVATKNSISTTIRDVRASPNLGASSTQSGPSLTLPTSASHHLHLHWK